MLSLKHRQDKSQHQRIIAFVGHPLTLEVEDYENIGMLLSRQSVAIDIVNFAHPENVNKINQLIAKANKNGNCHCLDVPIGVAMITDLLISSPIINEFDDGGAAAASGPGEAASANVGAGGQFADYGGVDPNLDPELAMAMRISLEEERAKQVNDAPAEGQ